MLVSFTPTTPWDALALQCSSAPGVMQNIIALLKYKRGGGSGGTNMIHDVEMPVRVSCNVMCTELAFAWYT